MAMVMGLIPILRAAIEATTDYQGRTLWLAFSSIRLITLYLAELPWSKSDTDFHCDVNASEFCRKACFNAHFDMPIVSLWNFSYILFLSSVLLMEFFVSQHRYNLMKPKEMEKDTNKPSEGCNATDKTSNDPNKSLMINFHKKKLLLKLYLTCIILRLVLEMTFLYILVFCHLPKVDSSPIVCSTRLCPGPYTCLVRAAVEKRMSVFMLCTISAAVICTSVIFGLYTTCHYMLIHRNKYAGTGKV